MLMDLRILIYAVLFVHMKNCLASVKDETFLEILSSFLKQ
jgi:hypothetical protein